MKQIVLVCSLILLMGCGNKEIVVQEIPFEFGMHTAEPNLVAQDGMLTLSWVTSIRGKEASLQFSQLKEAKWEAPKKVASGDDWFVNWADFPANAVNGNLILTSYLKKSATGTYTYDVVLNLQKLSGETVKENFLLNTDGIHAEHGFVSMIPNFDGGFFVTWLDGRNTVEKDAKGHHNPMTIRIAEVSKKGVISNEKELDSSTCDCCQTAITMTENGPVIVYRDRSEKEIRDIYITRRIDGVWTAPVPVFKDGWKIAGCPVNGPKIVSNKKNISVAWFTGADDTPKVNLSFSSDGGAHFEAPIQVSDADAIGRVDVLFLNSKEVLVSYMETDERGTFLKAKKVALDGTMSDVFVISEINGSRSTGVPQLEIFENEVYAVWTISVDKKNKLKSVKFSLDGF